MTDPPELPIVPTGAVKCPKCSCANMLRLRYLFTPEDGEFMRGSCSRCGYVRCYLPLDYEGSSNA